jgi:aryl-alcohol dehydrogenase-like predicted oxidoreductase
LSQDWQVTDSPPTQPTAINPLALGTMLFGTRTPEANARELLDVFVAGGGRWIDTADCYAFWLSDSGRGDDSENVIGRWLRDHPEARGEVLISTKIGAEPTDERSWRGWPENREGLAPDVVRPAVEGSLERLGVDRIDLLWLHQEDRSVPIEETVDAVAELVAEGLVGRLGASNHPAWRVERARAHALARGSAPIDAVQLAATYLQTRPGAQVPGNDHEFGRLSNEQLDHAVEAQLEVWAYTPLLRGAYDDPSRPAPEVFEHAGTSRRLAVLASVAGRLGLSPGQVVLAWLLSGRPSIRPIVGVSSVEQLDLAMAAAKVALSPETMSELDGVQP